MSDLTEHALEDVIAEIQSSDLALSILPTKMYLRPDVVAQLASEHGISINEMFNRIRQMVEKVSADL